MAGPDGSPFIGATVKSGTVNLGPISGLHEYNFWETDPKQGGDAHNSLNAHEAYGRVPWLYRAVNLRANTIADMPWSIFKGNSEIITSDKDDERDLPPELAWLKPMGGKGSDPTQDSLVDLLRKLELDLCLDGQAYWKRDANRIRTTGYRRWLPSTLTPKFSDDAGLIGFTRNIKGKETQVPVEEIAFWWLPSIDSEIGPGVAPAAVALRAAGLMANIDTYGEGFFGRGAINTTILTVEGNPQDAELRRLEQWWKRLVNGVRRAFETVAVRASIKPVVVGQPPKDLALDTLTEAKRHDVATALGVPMSVLDDKSANYATAKVSMLNYYRLTILPELELIESSLNQQVFSQWDLEFRFKPEEVEALQAEEANKAYEMLALVVGGVMTPNELRSQLNYDDSTDEGADKLRTPPVMGDIQGSPRTNADAANQATGGAPRRDGQAQGKLAAAVRPSEGSPLRKAMDAAAFADMLQALAPPAAKAVRMRRLIERDEQGRIIGVTIEPEDEVATLGEPFRLEGIFDGDDVSYP